MPKKIRIIVLVSIVVVVISCFGFVFVKELQKQEKSNLQSFSWVKDHIQIRNSPYGKEIKEVSFPEDIRPFHMYYQKAVDEKIQKVQEQKYTFQDAYLIYNPYGTNRNSVNIYFSTDEEVELSYTVKVDKLPDFTRTLKNEGEDNFTKEHAYQLIGFVMGKKNTVELTLKNKDQEIVDKRKISLDFLDVKPTVSTQLKTKEDSETQPLSDGLYVMFGHDKAYNANNYIYDNFGVLRGELILQGYRSDRIIFLDNGNLLYSYKSNGFIEVNRLGKIVRKYSIGQYTMHHDYIWDKENNSLLILANKNGADTIEDRVLALNLTTGKTREVMDMKDYLKEMYDLAIRPEENTYGGTELDWVHLNSLNLAKEGDIVLSSRELSMLIYVKNIYTNPEISYIITDPSVVEETSYEELNLEKVGNFVSQAGQHTITYQEKDEDEYYLIMYNNNYQGARTRPKFDWKNYPGTGTYEKGEHSLYYKYLVNEKEKTYELVQKIELPYSSIVSSVEDFDDHYVTSSGMSHCFDEYSADGKLIQEFSYTSKKYAYRVFKYSFYDSWFQKR